MTLSTHFFDPALERLYTEQLTDNSITWGSHTSELRHLFYQLNQSGQAHNIMPRAYGFIQHQLKQTEQTYATNIIQDYTVDQLASLQVVPIPPLTQQHWTQDNVHSWVKHTTAVLLTQACWLQHISPAAASQTLISGQLISLYLQLTRNTQQGVNLTQAYQAMLLATGGSIPNLYSHSFSQQPELIPEVLNFATLQLALSRFPRVLLPEILGFTLAYCQMPTLIEACFPKHLTPELFFQQRQSLLQQQIPPLRQCITAYLDLFPLQVQTLWRRIQNGFWLYQLQMQRSSAQFSNTLNSPLLRQHAVAKLLQQKAVAAIGHHHKIQLQGKSLDRWFSELPENTQEFLHALIQSDYVDRQNPANSQLLKLFAFKGPMFGVLNKSELESLLNWLQNGLNMSASYLVKNEAAATTVQSRKQGQALKNYAKFSNRELYYYLVNVDLFPDVLVMAKAKVSKLLRTCALFNPLPFKHYSHQQFDVYIRNIYQQEISTYKPLQGTPKISKAAYIWGFEQIAPLILIDGCWIQNSLALKNINPEICEILFST